MPGQDEWHAALDSMRVAGFRALPLDTPLDGEWWAALTNNEPPAPVRTFAQRWLETPDDPWQVLLDSVAAANPEALAEIEEDPRSIRGVFSLVSRIERVAIAHAGTIRWDEEDPWGYLVQFRHARDAERYTQVMLYPPAPPADIRQSEHVLNLPLPTTYRRFLLLTNGLQLGASGPFMHDIYGAGPRHANWTYVLLNYWSECEKFLEIAAQWRGFQGNYQYERIMDRERGEDSFLSDETALVPFTYTYEHWCFDRTRQSYPGEYPVMFWDHETRGATERYRDFGDWFAGEVESYLFGEG
jgi:SMI1 / KNR4 family (SUKH-1)